MEKGSLYLRRNTRFASMLNGSGALSGKKKIEIGDEFILLTDGASQVFPPSLVSSPL